MGNKTTVATVGIWGIIAILLLNTVKYFAPEFHAAVLAGYEAEIGILFATLASYLTPKQNDPDGRIIT